MVPRRKYCGRRISGSYPSCCADILRLNCDKGGSVSKLSLWKRISFVCAFCAATAIASPAQTFTSLVSFNGTDGSVPFTGPLVQGFDGNLYGTTLYGPTLCDYDTGTVGCGTVFKLSSAGALTTIYDFNYTQWSPEAGLVLGTDGNFYGTTFLGGDLSQDQCTDDLGDNVGCGTVFKITSEGKLTTLHSFDYTDGANPKAGLLLAADGNFYGTTLNGGTNGYGTIFEITPSGNLITLHSFDMSDGSSPYTALVEDSNGNFYGTADGGANGYGTVFKLAPDGTLTTLYNFCSQTGCSDGSFPNGLVQAADGNFYSTAAAGGTSTFCTGTGGCGTVFRITPAGSLTTLYNFCSLNECADGDGPSAALAEGTDGSFYGTTIDGGSGGCSSTSFCGTVFKVTPEGALTTLHSFDVTDGSTPQGSLVQSTDGRLYGTTSSGGTYRDGTAFRQSVGLSPFVESVPTSGKVGATVVVLGTDLKGATSVTFNGTAATFTVVKNSAITTTVPDGATTGKIQVTTPAGTLTSNVKFRVP
jgi:uncharacterized repeat protein (TIGR03803 family)